MKVIRQAEAEPIRGLIIKRKLTEKGTDYFSVEIKDKPLSVLLQLIADGMAAKVQYEALALAKMPPKRMKSVR